nr:MAG TPA: hypothetical protein [Caudoviricetes sp.]
MLFTNKKASRNDIATTRKVDRIIRIYLKSHCDLN